MKKIIILVLITLIFNTITNGQYAERTSAYNYLRNGKLDKAKEAIDKACLHEKTMNEPKTLYYAGQIYSELYFSENEFYKNLDPYALEKAYNFLTNIEEKDNNHYITNKQSYISLFSRIKSEYLAQQNEKKITHTTKQGETISSIAKKYDVSTKTITSSNPEMLFFHNLKENDTIIPLNSGIVFKFPVLKSTTNEATVINQTLTVSNNNTSNNQLDKKLENNSYVLTTQELDLLIDRIKNICTGPNVYRYYKSTRKGNYYPFYYKYPIIFYSKDHSNKDSKTYVKDEKETDNSFLINLFIPEYRMLDFHREEYYSFYYSSNNNKKDNYNFYVFNAYRNNTSKNLNSKIEQDDNTVTIVKKLNSRLLECQNILTNKQTEIKNWQLTEKETSLSNNLGFIPLTQENHRKRESIVKAKTGTKYVANHELYSKLPNEGKECEITFDVVYAKMFSTEEDVSIGFSLNKKEHYIETVRRQKKRYPYTKRGHVQVGKNGRMYYPQVTDYSRPEYYESIDKVERSKSKPCGNSRIELNMDKNSTVQKMKIVLTNSNSEIYINDVLKSSNNIDLVSANELKIFGNKVGIKNVKFRPIQSASTIEGTKEEIKTIHSFFNDLDQALQLGESFREYKNLVNTSYTTLENKNNKINSFITKYPEFPEYLKMPYIKNAFADVSEAKAIEVIIMNANDNKKEKYNKINDLTTSNWENKNKKQEYITQLKNEIKTDIQNKVDSICENTLDYSIAILSLVSYYDNMDDIDKKSGGEEIIKNAISSQVENGVNNVQKEKPKIIDKIKAIDNYLENLNSLAKTTYGYRKGRSTIKALAQKAIKCTVNMYYKTEQKREPLVTHKEIRDETSIGDALFGQTNFVEYTWTTGGNEYTDVNGYEVNGKIVNLTSKPILVKAKTNGSLRTTGNAIIDFGRAFTAAINQDKFDWVENTYYLNAKESENYNMKGNCTRFAEMSISFKVIEIDGIPIEE